MSDLLLTWMVDAARVTCMKPQGMRLLVLLWLGWYLSGPLCQTVDFWDSPQEEMGDIARSAGGAVTLIAAAVCFGIVLVRKLRQRCTYLARTVRGRILPLTLRPRLFLRVTLPAPSHSPPVPLRI